MNLLRRNLIVNFIGRGWTALMTLAFVPWFIHYLGIEAYGLVGFFASLQAVSVLLDLGLSTAINRGLATLAADSGSTARQRDLLRTMEVINWGLALVIGVVVLALAPLIASHWIHARGLSSGTVSHAVQLMGLTIALRWPCNLYAGALTGLQRQLSVDLISGAGATFANLGVIAVLAWYAPTIEAFFVWQMLSAALQTGVAGWWIWRCLPASGRPARFSRDILAHHWRFAAGMSGVTALTLLLTQTDKIILSKLLTLEQFGYYAMASTLANGLLALVQPVYTAAFPAFSTAVARGDRQLLLATYHRSARMSACLIMPPSMMIACFPALALWAWSGNQDIALNAAPALAILAMGSSLYGLMYAPIALQLAYGSTGLILQYCVIAVVVQVPLIIAGALLFGAPGAALGWPLLNLASVTIVVPIIHHRHLTGAHRDWSIYDTAIPMALTLLVVGLLKETAPAPASRLMAASILAMGLGVAGAATWLLSSAAASRRFRVIA
jgi:O-antigen/teichoic acid export membrane protein